MSTLWKLLVMLVFVYAVGGTLRDQATPHEAAPVRTAGCHPEGDRPDGERWAYFASRRFVSRRFTTRRFAEVLGAHDAFLPHLTRWRRLLADHASALARLVKTFPGTALLSEERIRVVLRSPRGLSPQAPRKDVFRPWAARWSGPWGNGAPQYHIWEPARCHEGRQVQLVSQSETTFPEAARLQTMMRRNQADLAVNVFSERFGVTGWVSKRQHGPREIPCLGYLLEPAMLLWICQTSGRLQTTPALEVLAQDGWFAYLESVVVSSGSPIYHIDGTPFEITRRGIRYGALSSRHTGQYRPK